MENINNKKGFTLVELILYVAIGSIVLLVITSFFQTNLSSRAKIKAISEVDQQGAYLMQTITQTIVNAEAINSPSIGTSATTLSLDVVDVADDPTLFNNISTYIYLTEGVATPIALNSNLVEVSNLSFTNMSKVSTLGNIRIQFDISFVNNTNRNEYDWTKTFYGSASLR